MRATAGAGEGQAGLVVTRLDRRAYAAPETPPPDPLDGEPYGPEDQRAVLAWWNAALPDVDGLLDAEPVAGTED